MLLTATPWGFTFCRIEGLQGSTGLRAVERVGRRAERRALAAVSPLAAPQQGCCIHPLVCHTEQSGITICVAARSQREPGCSCTAAQLVGTYFIGNR